MTSFPSWISMNGALSIADQITPCAIGPQGMIRTIAHGKV
jgi:hypothetical protein